MAIGLPINLLEGGDATAGVHRGVCAAAWSVVGRAQQRAPRVVAFLNNASFEGWTDRLRAFRETLREAGFAEGRNITIEFHAAEGDENRLATLTADLVRRRVDVVVANGIATFAAKAATSTIPVVFTSGGDPVERGMVASFNRPGGNLTGVVTNGGALGPKRLELLHEIAPAATDIGVLDNPPNGGTSAIQLRELASAADVLRCGSILRTSMASRTSTLHSHGWSACE